MPGRLGSDIWNASVDSIVATVAGGLAILVFYPMTLCVLGIKSLVRFTRPHLVNQPDGRSVID
jgi:hypothetical protein